MPSFSEYRDVLINFEPSLSVMVSNAISVKLALLGRYDGLPAAGKKHFDYLYTTSLVANY